MFVSPYFRPIVTGMHGGFATFLHRLGNGEILTISSLMSFAKPLGDHVLVSSGSPTADVYAANFMKNPEDYAETPAAMAAARELAYELKRCRCCGQHPDELDLRKPDEAVPKAA